MFIPATSTDNWQVRQSNVMYANNPGLNSCAKWQSAYDRSSWPKGDSIEVLTEIDERVRRRFDYTPESLDSWNSFDSLILGTNERFKGDCDDLAATVSSIALCAGIPRSDLGFALVGGTEDIEADHMIGFYKDPQGNFWAFGDTFDGPRPLHKTEHEIFMWNYLSEKKSWFRPDAETDFHRKPGYTPFGSVVMKEIPPRQPQRRVQNAQPQPWQPVVIRETSYVSPYDITGGRGGPYPTVR
jgi:predicted transglutaminase-like cysteine proteinase